jgi:hypothetical protein
VLHYGSHEMLHHAEPRLFFCLMHMFGIHKFEFVAFLNLNQKEKTKGKGIRKFRIKEKGKEARNTSLLALLAHQACLACARLPLPTLSVGRARPVSVALRPCAPLLFLCPWARLASPIRAPAPAVNGQWAPLVSFA